MADLYTNRLHNEGPEHTRCEFSLFSLLTSDKEFRVDGVGILRKGSNQWGEYLTNFRDIMKNAGIQPQELEEIMHKHSSQEYVVVDYDTPFYIITPLFAMHRMGKRLLYTHDGGVIGEVAVARKQIDFFQLAKRPFDTAKKVGIRYYYDGTLLDALRKFEQEEFTFNLYHTIWLPNYIIDGERTKDIPQVTLAERVPIDEIVNWQS